MRTTIKRIAQTIALLALAGCASTARSCSSCSAETYGADWLVVQYRNDGAPISCWRLDATSIANESGTDGIYWLDKHSDNLVHISGWYNRVQVNAKHWERAAENLGVRLGGCSDGVYVP